MAIQPKPKIVTPRQQEKAQDAFMTGAPDSGVASTARKAAPYAKGLPKGNKRQISLTIAPDLLRQVDERAEKAGIGRAAFISMAIFRALEAP